MNSTKREERQRLLDAVAEYLKREFVRFTEKAISRGQSLPTQAEFGRWLGVDVTTLSYWMTASRPPSIDNADAIATKLGPKIYEILGVAPRLPNDRYMRKIHPLWSKLNEQQKKELMERVLNMVGDPDDWGEEVIVNNNQT